MNITKLNSSELILLTMLSLFNGSTYKSSLKRTTTVGKDGIHFFTLEHGFQGGKARRGDPPPFGYLGK